MMLIVAVILLVIGLVGFDWPIINQIQGRELVLAVICALVAARLISRESK